MKPKNISSLAKDPRFIPGIYNYCDCWCERCSFTARCLSYALTEREDADDPATHDLHSEAFWHNLQSGLQQTRELITDWAAEQGIDLNSLDLEAAGEDHRRRREAAEAHELFRAARHYAQLVDQWFATELTPLGPKQTGAEPTFELLTDDLEKTDPIQDAVEIINWYQHQIGAKIRRGLMQDEEMAADDQWQNDSDGSVKVALIGVDRSITAWGRLLDYLPEKRESILTRLVHLDRLRRQTEQTFPRARDFIRPGFDELSGHLQH